MKPISSNASMPLHPPPHTRSPFRISVPASSANLGPGFDAIGLALDLRIVADVALADRTTWSFSGTYAPTHDGLRDEIARGIARVLGAAHVPPMTLQIANEIPLGKGLGGSAAGAVLGVAIGAHLAAQRPSDETLAQIITEIEGHPDNGLPAFFGGIVVAANTIGGPPAYVRIAPPPEMRAIVVTPQIEMPTVKARAILPTSYAKSDTVYNIQRAALLGAALAAGRTDLLRVAMDDRIHQPYRASFVPGLDAMLIYGHPALLGVALSGAGPSVIALVAGDGREIGEAFVEIFNKHGVASRAFDLAIATDGVRVTEAG